MSYLRASATTTSVVAALVCCTRAAHGFAARGISVSSLSTAARAAVASSATAARAGTAPAAAAASHPAFELLSSELVQEYSVTANRYVHKLTRAELLSVVSPTDDNKVFLAAFRTQPDAEYGASGVAHILEHSVLCGSAAYPLKAPFVELLKGSVHTFLNALTYPDRTVYPVASQSAVDFYNLMDVYLDATLCPCATDTRDERGRRTFEQEGWHVAAAQPGKEQQVNAPGLCLQGVVYNEMKGVYSSADALHGRTAMRALFQQNAYQYDSGGDPSAIPSLSYEQFVRFHATRYAPSSALLFACGDDPELERLSRIDAALLRAHEHCKAAGVADGAGAVAVGPVSPEPLRAEPWLVRGTYAAQPAAASAGSATGAPAGDGGGQYVSLNWLLASDGSMPATERLALSVCSSLLLGGQAAPLRVALVRSRLGSALIGGGLSDSLLQPTFSVGLKGVAAGDAARDAVVNLVLRTLERIADGEDVTREPGEAQSGAPVRSAFDAEAVEGALNSLEFSLAEFGASERRGLSLGLAAAGEWAHGRDPVDGWRYRAALDELRARLASEGPAALFGGLVRAKLLENKHRATVQLEPSEEHAAAKAKEEADALAKATAASDEAALRARAASLKAAQQLEDPPELIAKLPRLTLADIEVACAAPILCDVAHEPKATLPASAPPSASASPAAAATPGRVVLLSRSLVSAGVSHVDIGFSLEPILGDLARLAHAKGWPLPAEEGGSAQAIAAAAAADLHLLPLLWRAMREAGTKGGNGSPGYDEIGFSRAQRVHTGGIAGSVLTTPVARGALAAPAGGGFGGIVGLALLRGKALAGKEGELCALMGQALLQPDLENSRAKLRQIARESKAAADSAARSSGNALAASRIGAAVSFDGWIGEQLGGLSRARVLPELLAQIDDDAAWPRLLARLRSLHARLLGGPEIVVSLSADAANLDGLRAASRPLVDALAAVAGADGALAAAANDATALAANAAAAAALGAPLVARRGVAIAEGLRVPVAVSHIAAGGLLRDPTDVRGSSAVCSRLLRTGHLWSRVRVQGGAYGCGASLDRWSGALTLTSYRDPTPAATLSAFREAGAALRAASSSLPDAELERLVIGTLGALEPPSSAQGRAYVSLVRHMTGYTDAMRQAWRDEVRATSRADLSRFADDLDALLARDGAPPSVVAVGEQATLDAVSAASIASGGPPLAVSDAL